LRIDLLILDAVPGPAIDLVEADLLGLRRRGEKGYGAGHEGQAKKAFPVRTRGHRRTPYARHARQDTLILRRAKRSARHGRAYGLPCRQLSLFLLCSVRRRTISVRC